MGGICCSEPTITTAVIEMARTYLNGARAIADVGCGANLDYDRFIAEILGKRPVAIDFSMSFLRLAPRLPGVSLVQADSTALPICDASLDAVICSETIEHIEHDHRDRRDRESDAARWHTDSHGTEPLERRATDRNGKNAPLQSDDDAWPSARIFRAVSQAVATTSLCDSEVARCRFRMAWGFRRSHRSDDRARAFEAVLEVSRRSLPAPKLILSHKRVVLAIPRRGAAGTSERLAVS